MPTFVDGRSRAHLPRGRRPTRTESLNPYLPGSSRATVGKVKRPQKRRIMIQVQTNVCGTAKGAQDVDVAARPGRGADGGVRRHRRPGWAAGRDRRGALLGDRGEGAR